MLGLTKTVPVGRGAAQRRGARRARVRARHRRRADRGLPPGRRRPRADRGRDRRALSTPDGAQVGFTPDGRALDRDRARRRQALRLRGRHGRHRSATPRTIDSLGRHAVRVRDLDERDARRDRGVPRREGRGRGVELPRGRRRDHAGHRERRQRSQRDLLGRHLQRRPLRLHDELRRRRGVALRDRHGRRAHARGRHSRAHRRRSAGPPRRGPVRRRAVPVRDRRRPGPDRRLVGRTTAGTSSMAAPGAACRRPSRVWRLV